MISNDRPIDLSKMMQLLQRNQHRSALARIALEAAQKQVQKLQRKEYWLRIKTAKAMWTDKELADFAPIMYPEPWEK